MIPDKQTVLLLLAAGLVYAGAFIGTWLALRYWDRKWRP